METRTPLSGLVSYHQIKLSGEQSEDYKWFFSQRPHSEKIVATWKFRHAPQDRFPSLFQLAQIDSELREATWNKEKRQAPIFKDLKRNAGRTQHGKEALALMIGLYEGKLNREQYLEEMFAMEKKYPGLGWQEQARDLKEF